MAEEAVEKPNSCSLRLRGYRWRILSASANHFSRFHGMFLWKLCVYDNKGENNMEIYDFTHWVVKKGAKNDVVRWMTDNAAKAAWWTTKAGAKAFVGTPFVWLAAGINEGYNALAEKCNWGTTGRQITWDNLSNWTFKQWPQEPLLECPI